MIVKIDKLSHDFRGITKLNNKVTFIDNTLPSELVDIKLINEKKKINEGKVISYIDTSNDRIKPSCPYYGICGGCDTGHIKYDKQLEYKRNIVIDIVKRYASIDINPDIISNGKLHNYRNKISLKVSNNKLSLVKEGTSELVNIDKCLLVNDNINNVIKLLNTLDLASVNEVIIKGVNDLMVIVNGSISSENLINTLKDSVSSIILNDEVIYGAEYITVKVKDFSYAIYPKSFFQVNTEMIEKLYDKVLGYAGSSTSLLDLYCGAGTIGIYLSHNFERVKGIEVNKDAVVSANLNKKINNIDNISFECKSASEIDKINEDVVVVDPPRNGLDKTTINKLLSSNVKKIVYVSCNPLTLARDLNILKDKYTLEDITLFDMFPNTKHVESMVLLQERNIQR